MLGPATSPCRHPLGARSGPQEVQAPKVRTRERHVPLYRVLIHNDEVTPMEFVVSILLGRSFRKTTQQAMAIMLEAHNKGVALIEVVPLEIGELHVDQTHSQARARGYPLTLSLEPE